MRQRTIWAVVASTALAVATGGVGAYLGYQYAYATCLHEFSEGLYQQVEERVRDATWRANRVEDNVLYLSCGQQQIRFMFADYTLIQGTAQDEIPKNEWFSGWLVVPKRLCHDHGLPVLVIGDAFYKGKPVAPVLVSLGFLLPNVPGAVPEGKSVSPVW